MIELKSGHLQGATLYAYSRDFHKGKYDFEQLVREVARRGQGPGLEVIGFQSIRNWPNIDEKFISWFKGLMDETGLIPTSMATNADIGLRRDRKLNRDEMLEYMTKQINMASRLGFKNARVQISMSLEVMEALAPVAEKADIRLGLEVHSPEAPSDPDMMAHRELYEKLDTGYLGFIPDWGSTTVAVAPTVWEMHRKIGVPEEMIDELKALWNQFHAEGLPRTGEVQGSRVKACVDVAKKYGFEKNAMDFAINHSVLFGHADPKEWADIMHLVWHTHGKFFSIDANGDEQSTPLVDILKVYADAGYTGSISSEYEGFHWDNWNDPFDMVDGHQKRIRQIMRGYGYEVRSMKNDA